MKSIWLAEYSVWPEEMKMLALCALKLSCFTIGLVVVVVVVVIVVVELKQCFACHCYQGKCREKAISC